MEDKTKTKTIIKKTNFNLEYHTYMFVCTSSKRKGVTSCLFIFTVFFGCAYFSTTTIRVLSLNPLRWHPGQDNHTICFDFSQTSLSQKISISICFHTQQITTLPISVPVSHLFFCYTLNEDTLRNNTWRTISHFKRSLWFRRRSQRSRLFLCLRNCHYRWSKCARRLWLDLYIRTRQWNSSCLCQSVVASFNW